MSSRYPVNSFHYYFATMKGDFVKFGKWLQGQDLLVSYVTLAPKVDGNGKYLQALKGHNGRLMLDSGGFSNFTQPGTVKFQDWKDFACEHKAVFTERIQFDDIRSRANTLKFYDQAKSSGLDIHFVDHLWMKTGKERVGKLWQSCDKLAVSGFAKTLPSQEKFPGGSPMDLLRKAYAHGRDVKTVLHLLAVGRLRKHMAYLDRIHSTDSAVWAKLTAYGSALFLVTEKIGDFDVPVMKAFANAHNQGGGRKAPPALWKSGWVDIVRANGWEKYTPHTRSTLVSTYHLKRYIKALRKFDWRPIFEASKQDGETAKMVSKFEDDQLPESQCIYFADDPVDDQNDNGWEPPEGLVGEAEKEVSWSRDEWGWGGPSVAVAKSIREIERSALQERYEILKTLAAVEKQESEEGIQVFDPTGSDALTEMRPLALWQPMSPSEETTFADAEEAMSWGGDQDAPVFVEPRFRGMRVTLQKSADGRSLMLPGEGLFPLQAELPDLLAALPELAKEVENLHGPLAFDGYLMFLDAEGDVVTPPENIDTFSGDIRFIAIDSIYLPRESNVADLGYADRKKKVADALMAGKHERFRLSPWKEAKTAAEVGDAMSWASEVVGSMGASMVVSTAMLDASGVSSQWAAWDPLAKMKQLAVVKFMPIRPDGDEKKEHLVYGEALIPDNFDLQDDTISAAEVQRAAHRWMARYLNMKEMHKGPNINHKAVPVESYIAPVDFTMAGRKVKKGTWIVVTLVTDEELWGRIKAGELTGYSIGGSALKKPARRKTKKGGLSLVEDEGGGLSLIPASDAESAG